jgi:NSS family neurotransmitter:Na+ symporter
MRETFKTRFGALMALLGLAIGLGNIWRFPYMTGLFGGAAFLLLYLGIVGLIGIPAMMAELTLGRYARAGPVSLYRHIGMPAGRWIGGLACLTILMASGFYMVVIGWALFYLGATARRAYFTSDTQAYFLSHFAGFHWLSLGIAALVAVLLALIVGRGVRRGIEKLNDVLVPLLFLCFIPMIVRSLTLPGAWEGLRFLFVPDFSKLQPQVALAALGQAFFSLALGGHGLLMYGSYLSEDDNIPLTATKTAFGDTLAGVLAGVAIFPAVFAYGLDPQGGPGLTFVTLPRVFGELPFGQLVGTLFFLVAFIAGLTSLIGSFEILGDACHYYWGWSRRRAMPVVAAAVLIAAVPSLFSPQIVQFNDLLWATTMFPFGSVMALLGLGWCVARGTALAEVRRNSSAPVPDFWMVWIRWVIPAFILLVLIYGWWDFFHS